MPWTKKTPHQPVAWPHGRALGKRKKGRGKGPLINRPRRSDIA
jgi:hypothetical protein